MLLVCAALVVGCTGQYRRSIEQPLSEDELKRFAADIPLPAASPEEHLSSDLTEIKSCMLKVLSTTQGIDAPKFQLTSDSSGESFEFLEYGFKGNVLRFRVNKSDENGHDVFTFATGIGGISCVYLKLHFQFVEGLGEQCGARTSVWCL